MKRSLTRIDLKKQLKSYCLEMQQKQAETLKLAIQQVQESANAEKGTMEDRFESFREQCQIDRDMYAKQLQETNQGIVLLQKMEVGREYDSVMLGSVVVTDSQRFFVAISIGEIKLQGKKGPSYFAISMSSPLFKAIAGKKQGDSFFFRDKTHQIVEVF